MCVCVCVEFDWIGLDWIGLDWTELDLGCWLVFNRHRMIQVQLDVYMFEDGREISLRLWVNVMNVISIPFNRVPTVSTHAPIHCYPSHARRVLTVNVW